MTHRRSVLKALALSPMAMAPDLTAALAKEQNKLVISGLDMVRVRVNKRGNWNLPRLKTESGLTGLGDASQTINEKESLDYLKTFADMLRGHSVYDVEWFRRAVAPILAQNGGDYGRTPAACAASALEQCMWDIRGKALGVPAYEFFGGRIQDQIRVYANINRSTDDRTPAGFAANAQRAINDGFDAIKIASFDGMPRKGTPAQIEAFTEQGIACAHAVRDVIGSKRDLLVDGHSNFDLERGLDITRRMEPLDLFWLEEVTPRYPVENLAAINRAAHMRTAGGEGIHGARGFYPYIKAEAVDIVMPDVKVCGGMLELKKIAALAESAGMSCSPHGPASPIGNAAAAHVIATVPNFEIFEFSYGEVPWRSELVNPPEQVRNSRLQLSDRPGLGFTINEKVAAKYAV